MCSKCTVIMDNECVTVVRFGDKVIQFPHMETDSKELYIECRNGKYVLLDEIPKTKNINKPKTKKNETTEDTRADDSEEMVVL